MMGDEVMSLRKRYEILRSMRADLLNVALKRPHPGSSK